MTEKIKILVVEDEALIAENLRTTLEDLGYEVTDVCYTYEEAQEAIRALDNDLVLLDINLRDADFRNNGLRLANSLPKEMPFIFLTAYSDLDMIREATKLKPSGYLIKPVTASTLFATIQTTIEHVMLQTDPTIEPTAMPVENAPNFFFVKVRSERRKIFWKDIAYISAGKNYVKLRAVNSTEEYPIRGTLTFVLEQLVPKDMQDTFVRIGRAVSVNRYLVTAYDLNEVICAGKSFENTRMLLREMHTLFGNAAYSMPTT